MKNPKQLLCNQYNENLTNVSRTDKIGASNHLEMIDDACTAPKIGRIKEVIETGLDNEEVSAKYAKTGGGINPIAKSVSEILDNATDRVIEVSLVDGLMNSWNTKGFSHVTGSGLDKDAADANKETLEEPKTVFKLGDTVYDNSKTDFKGKVTEVRPYEDDVLIIVVNFENTNVNYLYSTDGRPFFDNTKTLSFTPYTIDVNQERPKPTIEKGKVVYCWDDNDDWIYTGVYSEKRAAGYVIVGVSGEELLYTHVSITNPLKD